MNTIDNISGEFNFPNDLIYTFTADFWMPTFSDTKEENRKKRIEKILSILDDKERT